jgi:hypothetical protein
VVTSAKDGVLATKAFKKLTGVAKTDRVSAASSGGLDFLKRRACSASSVVVLNQLVDN